MLSSLLTPVTYYSIQYPNGLYHVRTSPWVVRQEKTDKREYATITTDRHIMIDHLYSIHQHEHPLPHATPWVLQWRIVPQSKEQIRSGSSSQCAEIIHAYAVGKITRVKRVPDTLFYLSPGKLWDQGKYVWKPLPYAYWLSKDEAHEWVSYFEVTNEDKKENNYFVIPLRIEKEVLLVP